MIINFSQSSMGSSAQCILNFSRKPKDYFDWIISLIERHEEHKSKLSCFSGKMSSHNI